MATTAFSSPRSLAKKLTSVSEASDTEWNQLLQGTTALDVAKQKEKKVIALSGQVLVRDALQVLSSNNVLSAPVVEQNTFVGFVDVLDLAAYAWSVYQFQFLNYFTNATLFSESPAAELFFNAPMRDVMNASMWNPPLHIKDNAPLTEVIKVFASKFFRPHRVGVLNANNQFSNIISQSDLITFAASHLEYVPFADRTIADLDLVRAPLMIPMQTTFIDSLDALTSNRISGLGIIDANGRLVANFSASDLRGLTPEAFDYFDDSIMTFLTKRDTVSIRTPITCTPSTKFSEVIKTLATEKIHRIYVEDADHRPIGVITLSDIMPVLKRQKEKEKEKEKEAQKEA
jgi:CBS domain-containing protein